jgi:hypothetical protein
MCRYRVNVIDYESLCYQPLRPSKLVNEYTTNEIFALKQLAKASCQSTPRLLDVKEERQRKHDAFPGGYVVYILMTFVPGYPPWGFLGATAGRESSNSEGL